MKPMKKILLPLLIVFALAACNLPSSPTLSPDVLAATAVAQTLTAVAQENPSVIQNTPLASPTAESAATPGASATAPAASPTGGAATIPPNATSTATAGTPSATTLTVDSNTNCREGPATSYKVVIVLMPGTTYQMIARTADNKFWVVTEVGKSTACWVPAEMSNAFGNVSVLPVTTPSAPTSAAAQLNAPTGLRYQYNCQFDANTAAYTITVALTWTDRSDGEAGFRVYRNTELVTQLPANATKYTDVFTGSATTNYSYQIAAYNDVGQALGKAESFSCSG